MTIGRIPSVEGGIQPTIVDAKGDLIAGVAADSVNRLAVGSNDQVLVADSSTSTGLAWKSYGAQVVAGKNFVINGGMDIWQRGTSFASGVSIIYSADRWNSYRAGGATGQTVSRQTGTGVNQYAARVARDSGNTSTAAIQFSTTLETPNSIPLAGQTIVISFYARAGANYSSASSGLLLFCDTGTGTDQQILSGFTGSSRIISQTATLTTSWQRFSYSASVGSTATQIGLGFTYTPVGTAGANDWFEVTGVQLEVGSVATPFSRAAGTIQGELAACQRYFRRYLDKSIYQGLAVGFAQSTTRMITVLTYAMRTAPSITISAAGDLYAETGSSGWRTVTGVGLFDWTSISTSVYFDTTGLTTGQAGRMAAGSSNATLDLSAEL